jgi:hypothetical protein
MKTKRILLALAVAAFAPPALAQEHTTTDVGTLDNETATNVFPAKPLYSPYAGRNFPTRPFFGDTHLHTSISVDAGAFGCRLGPVDAYRFAKGEEVTASSGLTKEEVGQMMEEAMEGTTCITMMRSGEAPMAIAASMNTSLRRLRVSA